MSNSEQPRTIAILLFDGITVLDAIGPYEVLSRIPGYRVCFVAKEKGTIRSGDKSLGLVADFGLDEISDPEIILIPGGFGIEGVIHDEATMDWIRAAHEKTAWTTSVCTGALALGAAGMLDGKKATTHWYSLERLKDFGAKPTTQRMVIEGKIVTAAGVSAGIDMALLLAAKLAGDTAAQAIQLSIEYDPEPPFDSGSLAKAPSKVIETLNAYYGKRANQDQ